MKKINLFAVAFVAVLSQSVNANAATQFGEIGDAVERGSEIRTEYGRKIGAERGSIRKIGAVERGSEIRTEYGRKIGTEYPKKNCAEYGRGTNRKIGTEVNIGRGMYV